MNLSALQGEEKAFLKRLEDLSRAETVPRFSDFLTQRQVDIALSYAEQAGRDNMMLYGGYPEAERKMLGVFPSYIEPSAEDFPLGAVTVSYREDSDISHRDILGSCMGLLITRESIGDIIVNDGGAVLFATQHIVGLIVGELVKIGRVGVRCEFRAGGEIHRNDSFDHLRGTVKSLRIDSLVSLLANTSREKGAVLIKADKVQKNHVSMYSVSAQFEAGDVITIRGYGKFVVDNIGNLTKKGRFPVEYKKYR